MLSILVIVLFQFLFPQPRRTQPVTSPRQAARPIVKEETVSESYPQAYPSGSIERPLVDAQETTVETGKYLLTFSDIGGSLKNIQLKEYTEGDTDLPLMLVSNTLENEAIFAMRSNVLTPSLGSQLFDLVEKNRKRLTYSFTAPGKFKITKRYHFHNSNDYIELRLSIENLGDATTYKDSDIIGASNVRSVDKVMGRRFLEINSMVDGKIVRNTRVKSGESFQRGIISWTGIKERYFCVILKPLQDSEGVVVRQLSNNKLATGVRTKRAPIYPGAVLEDAYILYVGPNDIKTLRKLGFGLEQIVNYGVFGGISKLLLATLRIFHRVTRNWGVAIIMLTFLINMILFPLTKKSFLSMKKIQDVQPHIEKLREVHKGNPQKLNKELAEVYRQYKINPLGGCLPLLIQMPIFIALYQGLMRSIELKGASFLWIHDLSRPDNVPLPFSLPLLGNQIHVLPLLMVGAMFLQQKISTKSMASASPEQRQQQKFMTIFFPLFFGFLFYKFPSGLVLYWLTNTVLLVVEHSAMRKAHA